jgi:hypothetical protein
VAAPVTAESRGGRVGEVVCTETERAKIGGLASMKLEKTEEKVEGNEEEAHPALPLAPPPP